MPAILFAVFIDLVGFGIIVPILPFLIDKYDGDTFTGTALISVYSLFALVAGPVWGRMSDKFGRKPALAATFIGATASYVTLAHADSLLWLFIARAMSGAMAGNIGIVMAAMADMTTAKNRGRAMGYVGAAFGFGFAFGPAIGGLLGGTGDNISIYLPGLIAAALSFIAMILTILFVPETNSTKNDVSEPTNNQEVHWTQIFTPSTGYLIFSMFVLAAISQSITFSITPFWAKHTLLWDSKQVGFLLMGTGLAVAFIQAFAIGPMFHKFGETTSLAFGAIVNILGCLIIVIFPASLTTALIGLPMIMSGLTIAFPALNSILSQRTDKRLQGTALGFSNGLSAGGRVFGPLLAGSLFTNYAPSTPFILVALTGLIVMFWTYYESKKV
ncbi:MFS transporter [Kordiimonas sp. SCSIO 12610]|nr:MFS transporter [Kordiimonas sp. SCSIO 12610]